MCLCDVATNKHLSKLFSMLYCCTVHEYLVDGFEVTVMCYRNVR